MMRNCYNMSLVLCKHLLESYNVQSKIDLQPIDSAIQKDFCEVWMNIEESNNKYELTRGMPVMKKKSHNNRTIINLNLELGLNYVKQCAKLLC